MGAINFIGKRPTPSELSTTAGRVSLISDPMVGSRLTSQTSPRLGLGGLVLDNVATLPLFALCLRRLGIIRLGNLFGLTSENVATLSDAQLHERTEGFKVGGAGRARTMAEWRHCR